MPRRDRFRLKVRFMTSKRCRAEMKVIAMTEDLPSMGERHGD